MMDRVKTEECTNLALRKLTRAVSRHYDRHLSAAQLKTTQYTLLSHISLVGPVGLGKLARLMEMDASTLTRNMRPLLDQRLIVLSQGPDARSRLVGITQEGKARWETGSKAWCEAQQSLHARLGSQRVADLHAVLADSLKVLNEDGAEV